jgi:hypothetical protein
MTPHLHPAPAMEAAALVLHSLISRHRVAVSVWVMEWIEREHSLGNVKAGGGHRGVEA